MDTQGYCGLSIIAPCRNEEANIPALVERTMPVLDRLPVRGELVLIDDGSTDDTWTAICRARETDMRVQGVRHAKNLGIVPAWRSGLAPASGECVCLIDADLQNRPEDILRLYAAYRQGRCDIVQGVRKPVCTLHRHRLFTRGLNALLNLAFGTRLQDNKSGFLLCHREILADILTHRWTYRYFQALVGVSAAARGWRIQEIETVFDPRSGGQSFLSRFPIGPSMRIVWELFKFRTETWIESCSREPAGGEVSTTDLRKHLVESL